MWLYSTETIINSNKGKVGVDGDKRAVVLYKDGNEILERTSGFVGTDTLLIDGVNSFILKNIKYISKAAYADPVPEEASLTVVVPKDADDNQVAGIVRLEVALTEVGRVSSIMQNAYLRHQKPFFYEVAVTASEAADKIAEDLVKVINKDLAMSDFKFFTVAQSGAKLTFTAVDEHIRFVEDKLKLVFVSNAASGSGAKLLGFEDYTELAEGSIDTKGVLGQGTVEHLIKDLRIPTNASINPFAADQGGRPIPGGKYDQYLIEYDTDRHHVGHQVMGSVADVSRTSHILFLEETGAKDIIDLLDGIATAGSAWNIVSETVSVSTTAVETVKTKLGSVE